MVSFHIEPTSKCTLECPLCDRTWFFETFKKKHLHEIDINKIVDFVGVDARITMCGNNGDPIYHSRFIELCKKFKDNNCSLNIHTNGSAKTQAWWYKLNDVLSGDDCVTFALDGLEDTNHLYRKNAKWNSIIRAIEVLQKRKCKMVWKFIVFKHNQHQIDQARQMSKDLGFDSFRVEFSDRWMNKQDLMPDKKYISNYYQHQKSILSNTEYTSEMSPTCLKNGIPSELLYIDAEGDFYPCCWMGTFRYKYKSVFSPKEKPFNIKDNTLKQILENKSIKEFFDSTKQFTSAHECCKMQCGVKDG